MLSVLVYTSSCSFENVSAADHLHIKRSYANPFRAHLADGDSSGDERIHHHHQPPTYPSAPAGSDIRQTQVFTGYGGYPSNAPSGASMPSIHDTLSGGPSHQGSGIVARRAGSHAPGDDVDDLFPDIPEAKKRKFILVDDNDRQSRLRVRVTLDGVDTREIPDSVRKGSSVFPRSFFPREMQDRPPSPTGSRFFESDLSGTEDDGAAETEGRRVGRGADGRGKIQVKVPLNDGSEGDVAIPRMRRVMRRKEVRLNDLGYRMAWLQSRVFAGRTVFLQRARKSHTTRQLS